MNRPVDLTNCDREPIHIPGSIQPFGFLLGLQSDFTVCMASENVADYLGRDTADVFLRPVEDVLSKAAVDAIRARVDYLSGPDASERIFGVALQEGGKPFDISIHFSGVYLIIEAEPSVIEHDANSGEMVRLMVSRIRKTRGVTELAQEAARQLKVLNGFDRVMVYRFHPDGSGEVIAEVAASGLCGDCSPAITTRRGTSRSNGVPPPNCSARCFPGYWKPGSAKRRSITRRGRTRSRSG